MSSRYSVFARMLALGFVASILFVACSRHPQQTSGSQSSGLRAWAETALLAPSAGTKPAAGANFSTEFPVTFSLVTRRIDQSKLPFLELCQQDHGKLMSGKSVMGNPLRLGSKSYQHGLGTHSVSMIRVLLNKPAERFTAEVGVNADTKVGQVAFAVEVAGKEVYRSAPCKGGDAPVAVSVALGGAKEFVLRVLEANADPTCDWADWCDPKVTYTDKTSQWLDAMPVYDPTSDACCARTPSTKLLPKWTRTHEILAPRQGVELHRVTYTDPATGLKVSSEIKLFKDYSAVEWVARFTNTGSKDSPIVADVRGLNTRLDLPKDSATLHYAQGSRCNTFVDAKTKTGYDFQPYQMPVAPKTSRSFDSLDLSSTQWLPFYNLQWNGGGLIWAIGWSGRWQFDIRRDADKTISLEAGQRTLYTRLHPGESIRTPRMLLMSWEGNDRLRGHNAWRRLILAHYAPRHEGKLQMPPIASMGHLWAGGGGPKMNHASSLAWIDKLVEIGGEVFWMDAGWYCPGTWTDTFGTWDPDPTKFPHGLKALADATHAKGMKFLLWFCEQNVQRDSDIAKRHPEWVYNATFDVSNPDARKWLTEYISKRLAAWNVDMYRHDGGFTYLTVHDTPERQGITENHGIEGWYAHWDALLAKHPGLMIDNCAGGGQNIDLETTMRSVPLWQSDVECGPPAPGDPNGLSMVQVQNATLDLYVPLHATGVWGMENDPYWFRSAATTGVSICEGIIEPAFNTVQAKRCNDELKSLRELRLGDFYPLTDINLDDTRPCAWEFYRPDLHKGFAMVFRRGGCKQNETALKLRGIEPGAKYRVTFADENKTRVMTSTELENLSVTIAPPPKVIPAAKESQVALSASPKNNGVSLRAEDSESKNAPVTVGGREAWRSVKGGMTYFVVENPANRDGLTPKVHLEIEYFDEGTGTVQIKYDSSDQAVTTVPAAPGAWKVAGTFTLANTKKWKTFQCNIDDALFGGRCNGADIRLDFDPATPPAVASLKLTNRMRTGDTITLPPRPHSVLVVFEKL
ncbi:MAG: NPCBM/NEW2 domain-containing protein [Thermoguttaceae bacterium]